jgi:FkbM family methyltransferase
VSIRSSGKRAANTLLKKFGHAIEREGVIPSFDRFADMLADRGLEPKTIVDIGVAAGTPWLYRRWPDARYFLVDPTPQSLPHMTAWSKRLKADVMNCAFGEEEGQGKIKIRANHAGSSMYEEIGEAEIVEEVVVPVRRFDEMIPAGISLPLLVKIWVQGAELKVLRGMGKWFDRVEVIIVECVLLPTLKDAPDFLETMCFMAQKNFYLYDFIAAQRRPLDGALHNVNGVFVPSTSCLREDRRWSA